MFCDNTLLFWEYAFYFFIRVFIQALRGSNRQFEFVIFVVCPTSFFWFYFSFFYRVKFNPLICHMIWKIYVSKNACHYKLWTGVLPSFQCMLHLLRTKLFNHDGGWIGIATPIYGICQALDKCWPSVLGPGAWVMSKFHGTKSLGLFID